MSPSAGSPFASAVSRARAARAAIENGNLGWALFYLCQATEWIGYGAAERCTWQSLEVRARREMRAARAVKAVRIELEKVIEGRCAVLVTRAPRSTAGRP